MTRKSTKRKYNEQKEDDNFKRLKVDEVEIGSLKSDSNRIKNGTGILLLDLPEDAACLSASYLPAQEFLQLMLLNKTIQRQLLQQVDQQVSLVQSYFKQSIENIFGDRISVAESYFEQKVETIYNPAPKPDGAAINQYKFLVEWDFEKTMPGYRQDYRRVFIDIAGKAAAAFAMNRLSALAAQRSYRILELESLAAWRDELCIYHNIFAGESVIEWARHFSRQAFLDDFFTWICLEPFTRDQNNTAILIQTQPVEELKTGGMSAAALCTYSLAFVCRQKEVCTEMQELLNWRADYIDPLGRSLLTYAVLLRSQELFTHALKDLPEQRVRELLLQRGEFNGTRVTVEQAGVDEYYEDQRSANPLQLAAILELHSLIKLISQLGGGLGIYQPDDLTEYLHYSIRVDDQKMVEELLEKKAGIEACIPESYPSGRMTPLARAAGKNSESLIRLLLEHKADINGPDDDEYNEGLCVTNPLVVASRAQAVSAVRYLLEQKANVDGHSSSHFETGNPLLCAIEWDRGDEKEPFSRVNVVKLLVEHKASALDHAFHCAVDYKDVDIAKYLIEKVDVNSIYTYLCVAALKGFKILAAVASRLSPAGVREFLKVAFFEARSVEVCAALLRAGKQPGQEFLSSLEIMRQLVVVLGGDNYPYNAKKLFHLFYGDERTDIALAREKYHAYLKRIDRLEKQESKSNRFERFVFFNSSHPVTASTSQPRLTSRL